MNDGILETLLLDRTTKKNILWATAELGAREIQIADVSKIIPRHEKNRADQKLRTKNRAEIFTPPEICKLQNDFIAAPFENRPEDFIRAKFLEITCGEAPYITSRYHAATGEKIPAEKRVGLLDRKLRAVSAPVGDWTKIALRSVYGYEFQGDNLFLARRNIFDTAAEFLSDKLPAKELRKILPEVAEIISWNFWQMDGLTGSPPFMESENLFGGANCLIMDWDAEKAVEFGTLARGARR